MRIHIKSTWNFPASSTANETSYVHAQAQFITEEQKDNYNIKDDKSTYEEDTVYKAYSSNNSIESFFRKLLQMQMTLLFVTW